MQERPITPLERVFEDGVLIDLDISIWTMETRMKPEDLGLDPDAVVEVFRLGKKLLLPAEARNRFRRIESRARYRIEQVSFAFPISQARFVPKRALPELLEDLEELREEFNSEVDRFVEDYEALKEKIRPHYIEAAEHAWTNSHSSLSLDEFVRKFLDRLDSLYPQPNEVRNRFDFSYHVFEVQMPREHRSPEALSAEERARREAEKRMLEQLQTQYSQRINTFLETVVTTLRQRTAELCQHVAEKIRNGEAISERTLKSMREFVAKFRTLNFVGDQQIEAMLENLEKRFLSNPASLYNSDGRFNMRSELEAALKQITDTATDLSDISRITGDYKRRLLI